MKKVFFILSVFTMPLCTMAQEAPRIVLSETMRPPVMMTFKALFAPEYAGYTRMLIAASKTVIVEMIKRDETLLEHPVGMPSKLYEALNTLSLIESRLSSEEPHDEMMAFVHQWVRDCTQDFKAQIAETDEEISFMLNDTYKALKTLQDPSITPFAAMKIHGASQLGQMVWDAIINHSR